MDALIQTALTLIGDVWTVVSGTAAHASNSEIHLLLFNVSNDQFLRQNLQMQNRNPMKHFRKALLSLSLFSLLLIGCSERKSAMPAAGGDSGATQETKSAAQEASPAVSQPSP